MAGNVLLDGIVKLVARMRAVAERQEHIRRARRLSTVALSGAAGQADGAEGEALEAMSYSIHRSLTDQVFRLDDVWACLADQATALLEAADEETQDEALRRVAAGPDHYQMGQWLNQQLWCLRHPDPYYDDWVADQEALLNGGL